jgi:hypothetical protein
VWHLRSGRHLLRPNDVGIGCHLSRQHVELTLGKAGLPLTVGRVRTCPSSCGTMDKRRYQKPVGENKPGTLIVDAVSLNSDLNIVLAM